MYRTSPCKGSISESQTPKPYFTGYIMLNNTPVIKTFFNIDLLDHYGARDTESSVVGQISSKCAMR